MFSNFKKNRDNKKFNRERLFSVIKTIIFNSKQKFTLKAHRDDENLFKINESESLVANDCNLFKRYCDFI